MEAIAWYESNHPGLSFDFRLSLDATLDHIARYPDSCARVKLPSVIDKESTAVTAVTAGERDRAPHALSWAWGFFLGRLHPDTGWMLSRSWRPLTGQSLLP
jgi:hypothetical protein